MLGQLFRSVAIFRLALTFIIDYWRVRRIERKYSGEQKTTALARVYAQAGARVRRAAFRLQGLIVKVGQFLSARSDVLPVAFTRELTQLQDAVPGADYTEIRKLLEDELGADIHSVFEQFDEIPLAAASLGQVHKAILRDGQLVAVKIQRPDIERLAGTDLAALRRVVGLAYRFTKFGKRMNLPAIYQEFEAMVRQELDYRMEAENLRRFRKTYSDSEKIIVPNVLDTYVTKRVLVMEYIDGRRITDLTAYDSWDVSPTAMGQRLLRIYLHQMLVGGFFHADPHPGNLLVLPDGSLGIVDFGMMSEIPRRDVDAFARLVKAALVRDIETVVESIDDLGFLQPTADRAFLKKAVGFMIDRIGGLKLRKGPELDAFMEEFEDFVHDEPLIVQAKYMFLGRAVGMLAGVVSTLHPNIDWIAVLKDEALPLLTQSGDKQDSDTWMGRLKGVIGDIFGETAASATDLVFNQLQETGLSLIRSPGVLEKVLRRADAGELTVKLELTEVLVRLDRQDRLIRRSVWLLGTGVLVAVSIWSIHHHQELLSYIGFTASVLALIKAYTVGRNRKGSKPSGRHSRRRR